ncbi:hypothetical protein LJR175_008268 [Variovorax sp. LjRoot175]|uniref:hypothetical protein n=1 Tax=Variovorax sp. LjRoot175 TaxID=3342276 RepID=UPI003ED02161
MAVEVSSAGAVQLPNLVARDLLIAALARLVPPDTTLNPLGLDVTCTTDGEALLVRVPSFARVEADAPDAQEARLRG